VAALGWLYSVLKFSPMRKSRLQPYRHFAKHYHAGNYIQFSQWISQEVFPHLLTMLNFSPHSLLDLACGSGVFAVSAAQQGLDVTGLAASADMLTIGQELAREANVQVSWVQADMSSFTLPAHFDCITCFFDSLNYLLRVEDLFHTFQAAYAHLNPGGYFIFDMNTIYGLAVVWQRFPYNLAQDQPNYMEFTEVSYDYELEIANMRVIMFERGEKRTWVKHEELHQERGYHVEDVLLLLSRAGFELKHLFGHPIQETPLLENSGRMWVIVQKPA
jgi:SAM-dependent methyltransferase